VLVENYRRQAEWLLMAADGLAAASDEQVMAWAHGTQALQAAVWAMLTTTAAVCVTAVSAVLPVPVRR
jgi:hypothetical protein